MKVLITGSNGFIARNLISHLEERQDIEILCFTRNDSLDALESLVEQADFVFHLAGVNRPQDPKEFQSGNTDLTRKLCETIETSGRNIPVLYTSSSQAELDNLYGNSKRNAEKELLDLNCRYGSEVHIFRLPNVFGKWARPNYNSAVATFCHNIARDIPIQVNDAQASITLVYVDDVIAHFIAVMEGRKVGTPFVTIDPQFQVTVGELAEQLYAFRDSRTTLVSERVGSGLVRALHSTYLSNLPPERFAYEVPKYGDQRGVFVEMLKTKDSGQFSFLAPTQGLRGVAITITPKRKNF
ncbi:NAD-dependent epimerase/dehydratase family protein [Microbulbifer sp. MLAF003]|uniref:NAD-dependent epimerase/dehydratase family protein n=1 Tax=Microbulbifer sp. MLAF003 TaxID=3032582 RepID=UPI0024AD98E3|nr:NAD-dependent epimerase/dehydratase family protein [Microbulbifer sp. MLAF003]WHI52438.1 NAD-dependent epimerase/dehydratase family protein [Microbulbifer sp. MLAF003]